ncbi:MAG: VCBS repeat-containing protein [Planctomycetota bacterium]
MTQLLLAWILLQAPEYVRSALFLPEHPRHLVSQDLDGDGLNDLAAVFDHRLVIWRQRAGGRFDFAAPDQTLAIAARAASFDFADLEHDGKCELILLEDGTRVVVYRMDGEHHLVRDPEPLVAGLAAIIMDGLRHLRFARDVDGDGKLDLIIPVPDAFLLFLQARDAQGKLLMNPGPKVAADVSITITAGTGRSLGEGIGETVVVPFFRIRDVNGDGKLDLVSETSELMACYLAGKDGLPMTPTFTLDLKALRSEIASADEEAFDPNNIAKGASETVDHRAADINHDGIEDHVIRQGQKVSLYLGTPAGVDFSKPNQVLKASGNVLTHWVTDADGDGLLDLHILRMEDISIAEVLLWLVKAERHRLRSVHLSLRRQCVREEAHAAPDGRPRDPGVARLWIGSRTWRRTSWRARRCRPR